MTAITCAESEFEDTVIINTAATTNYVDGASLFVGKNRANIYNVIIQLDLAKRPRFIPYLGGSEKTSGDNGYTSESAFSTRTSFFAPDGFCFVSEIKRGFDFQNLGAVTYNKITASPNVDWTTAGGLDDLRDEPSEDITFVQSSTNTDFDLRLGSIYTRRAMFSMIHLMYHNNSADDVFGLVGSQEGSGASEAEIILRGRYATRNRENPIRSRKFGVR